MRKLFIKIHDRNIVCSESLVMNEMKFNNAGMLTFTKNNMRHEVYES